MPSRKYEIHIERLMAESRRLLDSGDTCFKPVCRQFPAASVLSVPEESLRSGFFNPNDWRVFVENEFFRKITAAHLNLRNLFPSFEEMLKNGECSLSGVSLISLLGHGTDAVVYLTSDGFALKVVPASLVAKLRKEFELLKNIRHANIVRVYDFFVMQSGAAMLMERIYPDITVFRDYRSGLQSVHRHGYLHGDIRRSNIGRGGDGTGKLFDFGNSTPMTQCLANLELKHLFLLFDLSTQTTMEQIGKKTNNEKKAQCLCT